MSLLTNAAALQALLGLLLVAVLLAACARRLFVSGRRRRRTAPRSALPGGVFDVVDEVFSPARHQARLDLASRENEGSTDESGDKGNDTDFRLVRGDRTWHVTVNRAPSD